MRLEGVRHQARMFFLRFRVKMAALFGVNLIVIASQHVPMALAVRHGVINADFSNSHLLDWS